MDEGSFDSWGSFKNAFFVFCINEDEQTFSLFQVYIKNTRVDKFLCLQIKNEVTENMHLWLTCYFIRLIRERLSLSMLPEGYLL